MEGRDDIFDGYGDYTPEPVAVSSAPAPETHEQCHDLVCNGSRNYPRGAFGHCCSCRGRDVAYQDAKEALAQVVALQAALKALCDETERCDKPGLWGVSVYDDVYIKARAALSGAQPDGQESKAND